MIWKLLPSVFNLDFIQQLNFFDLGLSLQGLKNDKMRWKSFLGETL